MTSYRLTGGDSNGGDDLEEARFPTLADAKQVQEATEYGGDGYFTPQIVESDDPPNTTADDYLYAAWPDYPGPCPEGTDPEEWFAQCID